MFSQLRPLATPFPRSGEKLVPLPSAPPPPPVPLALDGPRWAPEGPEATEAELLADSPLAAPDGPPPPPWPPLTILREGGRLSLLATDISRWSTPAPSTPQRLPPPPLPAASELLPLLPDPIAPSTVVLSLSKGLPCFIGKWEDLALDLAPADGLQAEQTVEVRSKWNRRWR